MTPRTIAAALILSACGPTSPPSPTLPPGYIIPTVTFVDACTVTRVGLVRYTYTLHGTGWWYWRTPTGHGIVTHYPTESTFTFHTVGETWVMFTPDPDDDGTHGIEAGGGHLAAIWPANKECP